MLAKSLQGLPRGRLAIAIAPISLVAFSLVQFFHFISFRQRKTL